MQTRTSIQVCPAQTTALRLNCKCPTTPFHQKQLSCLVAIFPQPSCRQVTQLNLRTSNCTSVISRSEHLLSVLGKTHNTDGPRMVQRGRPTTERTHGTRSVRKEANVLPCSIRSVLEQDLPQVPQQIGTSHWPFRMPCVTTTLQILSSESLEQVVVKFATFSSILEPPLMQNVLNFPSCTFLAQMPYQSNLFQFIH